MHFLTANASILSYFKGSWEWLLDGRIGESHTLVYPDKRGFDGKCIPKDTNAIYQATKAAGV